MQLLLCPRQAGEIQKNNVGMKNAVSVFVTLVEVKPTGVGVLDPSECDGAIVRCYLPARSEHEARELLRTTFRTDRIELIDEEWFVNNDSVDWDDPDNEDALEAIDRARSSGELVYSTFHTWDHDST